MTRKMSFKERIIAMSSSLGSIYLRLSIEIFAIYCPFKVIEEMWLELSRCDRMDSSMFSRRGRMCWFSKDSRATLGFVYFAFFDYKSKANLTSMFRKDWKSSDLMSGLFSSFDSNRLTSFSVTVFHCCFYPKRFILSSWICASLSSLVKLACLIKT